MTDGHTMAGDGRAYENAFDPIRQAELFDGVRGRRMFAFLIDVAFIVIWMAVASAVIAVLGLLTLSLGWLLFALVWPFVPVLYVAFTLGGSKSATPGMRITGLQMRTWYGAPMYPLLAIVHGVLFWFSIVALTPLILIVSLFNPGKRLLHDYVSGTIVIRKPHP